jgi:PRTRC genetic system protein B
LNPDLNVELTPNLILLFYKSQNHSYIESHEVKENKILAGRPLTKKVLMAMMQECSSSMYKQMGFKGIVPVNFMYYNMNPVIPHLIWKVPASKRKLFFSKDMNIPSGVAEVPNLIFEVDNGSFNVFAYKEYVKENTQLYLAPFQNVSSNGTVCTGDVKIKDSFDYIEQMMAHYEDVFFRSEFSGVIDQTEYDGKLNLQTLWHQQIVHKTPFPYEILEKSRIKLKSLLS